METTTSLRKSTLAFIYFTVILDVLALGVIIPVLPKIVEEFTGGNTAQAATYYGLFGTVWALMQFFFSPVLGTLSDRFGRRPVILISCLGLGLDYVLMALAPNLAWLFVGRVISGITAASFSTVGAYIADVTPPEKRAASFGMIGAMWGFGFVFGPALGGLLGGINPRLPFWVSAGMALLNAAYGLFVLPESLARENRQAFSWQRANPLGALKLLQSHHELLGLAGVNFLYNLAHQVYPSVFVLYVGYRYGWDARTVGLTLAIVGVCGAIVQGVLVKPIVANLRERKTLLAGLLFGSIAFTIYGLAPTGNLFWLGIPIGALMGLFGPAMQGLMTQRVGPHEQGQLQGANSSIMGITGLIGPGLFTQIFALFIGAQKDWHLPGAPFLLAGGLTLLGLLFALRTAKGAVHHPVDLVTEQST
ncbi:MAG TPA: TCR/Tet family MFS transporter [Blastocatellia bacterium]|nr:TCR/Tet family MFS transporter [Blastocatellia bacterium]